MLVAQQFADREGLIKELDTTLRGLVELLPSDRRDIRNLLVRICQEIADDAGRRP